MNPIVKQLLSYLSVSKKTVQEVVEKISVKAKASGKSFKEYVQEDANVAHISSVVYDALPFPVRMALKSEKFNSTFIKNFTFIREKLFSVNAEGKPTVVSEGVKVGDIIGEPAAQTAPSSPTGASSNPTPPEAVKAPVATADNKATPAASSKEIVKETVKAPKKSTSTSKAADKTKTPKKVGPVPGKSARTLPITAAQFELTRRAKEATSKKKASPEVLEKVNKAAQPKAPAVKTPKVSVAKKVAPTTAKAPAKTAKKVTAEDFANDKTLAKRVQKGREVAKALDTKSALPRTRR